MIRQGTITGIDHDEAVYRYGKAIKKGVVKVMSKMGISTIQSYRGAQIFEAIGLHEDFVRKYFDKTASRVGGIGLAEIAARDALSSPSRVFQPRIADGLAAGGGPVPVAARRRAAPLQSRDRLSSPARHAGGPIRHLQEVHAAWSTTRTSGSARCAACSSFGSARTSRCRSTRSSRSSRSSGGSRPAR